MNYKMFSLSKMGDKLIKAMEHKEHFDKREKQKLYTKKVENLKNTLTEEYKFATQHKVHHSHYLNKLKDIEKDINSLKKVQNKDVFEAQDMALIDSLEAKYGPKS